MLVVADTSPFIGLIKIDCIHVLPGLFRQVVIPIEVLRELQGEARIPAVRRFAATPPAWLLVKTPQSIERIPRLDIGECAAISLAIELKADVLLIDENLGWQAAIARKLPTTRTAAVLAEAAKRGILADLEDAFAKLKATNFPSPCQRTRSTAKGISSLQRTETLSRWQITSPQSAKSPIHRRGWSGNKCNSRWGPRQAGRPNCHWS